MHQTLSWSTYWAKTMLRVNANPTAAHHRIASLNWMIYRTITKHPLRMQVWQAYLLCSWRQASRENLWRHSSGSDGGAVFTNCFCSCPQHGNFYNSVAEPDRELLKLPIRVYGEPMTVEKMDRSSSVGAGKYPGGIQLHQMYMTRQRKLIPGIQTGFCWAMEHSAAFE